MEATDGADVLELTHSRFEWQCLPMAVQNLRRRVGDHQTSGHLSWKKKPGAK